MSRTPLTLTRRGLGLALLFGLAAPAFAQNYPSKPITLVVPFPAGGATDVQARALAQAAAQQLKQQDQPNAYMDSKAYTAYAAQSYADGKRFISDLKIKLDE